MKKKAAAWENNQYLLSCCDEGAMITLLYLLLCFPAASVTLWALIRLIDCWARDDHENTCSHRVCDLTAGVYGHDAGVNIPWWFNGVALRV